MKLSELAEEIYKFLEECEDLGRSMPLYEEIGARIKRSKSNVKRYLRELKAAGLIDYEDGKPRTIRLLKRSTRIRRIPIGGSISAGFPIPSIPLLDTPDVEYLTFTREQLAHIKSDKIYALRVNGDSMIDAGILDRDWILVVPADEYHEGDLIVWWIVDEQATTLKEYRRDGNNVILQPRNPNYEARPKPEDQLIRQGKVVSVWRECA